MKPSFQTEWLALPPKSSHQVLEKLSLLTQDPTPDAKVKKQLKYMGGKLHRLRCGDYRIFYTFEEPYISLLALRRRNDDTYDEELDAEFLGGLDPDLAIAPEKTQVDWEKIFQPSVPQETPLPEPITTDLLTRLRIPEACHQRLVAVTSREKLFDCPGIPDEMILKLDEYLFERPLVEVLNQPDYLAGDVDDLLRFKEGDLLGFLLKLNPEQEKYVTWATNTKGPALLKGGPGTGKSTVALYRTAEILRQLQAEGIEKPKILFTTYTKALTNFSEQLLRQLLGDEVKRVKVQTADGFLQSLIYRTTGKPKIATDQELRELLQQAIPCVLETLEGNALQQQAQQVVLERLNPEYLLAEISDVIDGRGIESLKAYQATPRNGRLVPLNKTQRQAIWSLRSHLHRLLAERGLETWAQVRLRALHIRKTMENPPLFDAVIVDETQDLSPTALRFLVESCREPNRLFLTADANQSIYGNSFRWSDVHESLNFKGRRTGILQINHRTTREIGEAAYDFVHSTLLDADLEERQYIHTGPSPAVRAVKDSQQEAALLAHFCRTASREFRLGLGACAILSPSERSGRVIADQLKQLGVEAQFMSSRELDLTAKGVKVLTLKSAKGLEFPIVAIAGFCESRYPYIPPDALEEAQQEILMQEKRTLFVGMTRAMRALLVIVPSEVDISILNGFNEILWNLGHTTAA